MSRRGSSVRRAPVCGCMGRGAGGGRVGDEEGGRVRKGGGGLQEVKTIDLRVSQVSRVYYRMPHSVKKEGQTYRCFFPNYQGIRFEIKVFVENCQIPSCDHFFVNSTAHNSA